MNSPLHYVCEEVSEYTNLGLFCKYFIMRNLKIETKMNKLLEQERWRIVKEINIVSINQYEVDVVIGVIIYNRKLTSDYKLNDDPEPDLIKRRLDYPRQDLFTVDEMDELILNAIKTRFPKSFVRNYQVIFDSPEKSFNYFLERPSEKAMIEISPDFSDVDIYNSTEKKFPIFKREINIYQSFTLASIKSHFFKTTCNFERRDDLIKELYKIEFQ